MHKDHLFCLQINKTEKLIKLNYDDEFSNYLLSTHNREITYEDCYFFGYFLKTGTYDSNNNYYISISDSDLINLHNHFDYFETISEHKNLNNNTYTKFKITDYKYYNYLHKFGNKKFNKFIPEWVVNLPPKYLTYFLKGFNYKNQNRFIVYSKQLAYTLQRIFAKMHLYLSITFLSFLSPPQITHSITSSRRTLATLRSLMRWCRSSAVVGCKTFCNSETSARIDSISFLWITLALFTSMTS